MAAITQYRGGLAGSRRYGSFAGRALVAPDGPHPVGRLTQYRGGLAGGRGYGSFALKQRVKAPAASGDAWPSTDWRSYRVFWRPEDGMANPADGETLRLTRNEDKTFGIDFTKEGAVRDGGVLSDPEITITRHPTQLGSPAIPVVAGGPEVIPDGKIFRDSDGRKIRAGNGVRVRIDATGAGTGKFVVSCLVTVTDEDDNTDRLESGGILIVE